MAEQFNVNEILEIEMASMSIDMKTGYRCKECKECIFGHYVLKLKCTSVANVNVRIG